MNKVKMIIKHVLILVLIIQLGWQCFLGLRDSDKLTFENRVRETIKFFELYEPKYKEYVHSKLNMNVKNLDGSVGQNIIIIREISASVV